MNRVLIAALAVTTVFSANAFGASSKFAAHVSDDRSAHLLHSGTADTYTPRGTACEEGDYFYDDYSVCYKVDEEDAILRAMIKTPNKKDLLIGVSLESAIYTDTTVKGKNGSAEKAGAEAGILVKVLIDPEYQAQELASYTMAYPREVVFAHRIQELSAVLGGVIESCNVSLDVTGTVDDLGNVTGTADGTIIIGRDCEVTEEEIGLALNTTSANHFNFVAPDLTPGEHTVVVMAKAMASAAFENGYSSYIDPDIAQVDCVGLGGVEVFEDQEYVGCEFSEETADNEAQAWSVVNIGSLTVEEVRATNQEGGITIDMDQ
jgi:hypothetical protein